MMQVTPAGRDRISRSRCLSATGKVSFYRYSLYFDIHTAAGGISRTIIPRSLIIASRVAFVAKRYRASGLCVCVYLSFLAIPSGQRPAGRVHSSTGAPAKQVLNEAIDNLCSFPRTTAATNKPSRKQTSGTTRHNLLDPSKSMTSIYLACTKADSIMYLQAKREQKREGESENLVTSDANEIAG